MHGSCDAPPEVDDIARRTGNTCEASTASAAELIPSLSHDEEPGHETLERCPSRPGSSGYVGSAHGGLPSVASGRFGPSPTTRPHTRMVLIVLIMASPLRESPPQRAITAVQPPVLPQSPRST